MPRIEPCGLRRNEVAEAVDRGKREQSPAANPARNAGRSRYGNRNSAFAGSKALERKAGDAGMDTDRMHPRFPLGGRTARAAGVVSSRPDNAILDSTAAGSPARWSQEEDAPAVLADCPRCDDILYHHRGSAPAAKPMG